MSVRCSKKHQAIRRQVARRAYQLALRRQLGLESLESRLVLDAALALDAPADYQHDVPADDLRIVAETNSHSSKTIDVGDGYWTNGEWVSLVRLVDQWGLIENPDGNDGNPDGNDGGIHMPSGFASVPVQPTISLVARDNGLDERGLDERVPTPELIFEAEDGRSVTTPVFLDQYVIGRGLKVNRISMGCNFKLVSE